MVEAWRDDLTEWLAPFVGLLGDRRRARMSPAYVEGLIGPGDRKSVQPMAIRSPGIGYDQRHRFYRRCPVGQRAIGGGALSAG
jgi:SRSO17 transposase